MGEWCGMHHGENWGNYFCDDNDAFARVYNNLLLHEYIYYFTPVHFALFSVLIYHYRCTPTVHNFIEMRFKVN